MLQTLAASSSQPSCLAALVSLQTRRLACLVCLDSLLHSTHPAVLYASSCTPLPGTPPAPPQDEIHKRYKHGSALQMMCWMNFWSASTACPACPAAPRALSCLLAANPAFPALTLQECPLAHSSACWASTQLAGALRAAGPLHRMPAHAAPGAPWAAGAASTTCPSSSSSARWAGSCWHSAWSTQRCAARPGALQAHTSGAGRLARGCWGWWCHRPSIRITESR